MVGIRHKPISLQSIHLDSKDSTCHHHSHLTILFEGKLTIVRHLIDDHIIVSLNVLYLLANLILEWTPFQPCSLFLCVKDWEVVECLWQNVDVFVVEGA